MQTHSEHKSRELEGSRIHRWTMQSKPKVSGPDQTRHMHRHAE